MAILRVEALKKYYGVKDQFRGRPKVLKAVDGVDFSISENGIFALVGESGCGKSTIARLVLRLIQPTSGSIFFQDRDIVGLKGKDLLAFRKSVQIIFQDPFASLNPRKTVLATVSEPLKIHKLAEKRELKDAAAEILNKVGLDRDVLGRYPHEFSGGQRQRICIARALAVSPSLIVADEPLSALDVSIQAQILNLLREIKEQSRLSFLFISHDLNVVHYFSDYIGVMYLGRIVEQSKTEELFKGPLHPYTEILLASAPRIKTKDDKAKNSALPNSTNSRGLSRGLPTEGGLTPLLSAQASGTPHSALSFDTGEVPSPIDIPSGCPFHTRCPKRFGPCDKISPLLKEPAAKGFSGRLVACHLWNTDHG